MTLFMWQTLKLRCVFTSVQIHFCHLVLGSFTQDIGPLLAPDIKWDYEKAAIDVYEKFIPLLFS